MLPSPTSQVWRRAPFAGLSITLLAMLVVVAAGVRHLGALGHELEWVDRSHQAIERLTVARAEIQRLHVARRNHGLTADPVHVLEMELAIEGAGRALDDAGRLIRDDPSERRTFADLRGGLDERVTKARRNASVRVERGFEPTAEAANMREASVETARIAGQLDAIVSSERRLLARRQRAAARSSEEMRLLIVAAGVVGSVALTIAFVLFARELRRRIAAEAEARAEERSSRLAREKFQRLLAATPDAILIADAAGTIVLANDQCELVLGYTKDELLGTSVERLVPEQLRAAHVAHRHRYVSAPAPRPMLATSGRLMAVAKGGREFSAEISLGPIQTDDGMLTIAAIRDVTAQREHESELTRAQEETLAANRQLDAFSYSVAHDLRSPLRSIDGFSLALSEDCGDTLPPLGRDHLERIRAAAQRMGQLIDDLLALSRVSRAELMRAPMDVSAVAGSILGRLREADPGRKVDVRVQPGMRADADVRLVTIALENLLENAWKFTSKKPEATIEVGVTDSRGSAAFFVRDDGVGFSMAHAGKLFGPFQRLHAMKEFSGTGIGLATVERIVHRHGGQISVNASPDQGATFSFSLGSGGTS